MATQPLRTKKSSRGQSEETGAQRGYAAFPESHSRMQTALGQLQLLALVRAWLTVSCRLQSHCLFPESELPITGWLKQKMGACPSGGCLGLRGGLNICLSPRFLEVGAGIRGSLARALWSLERV